VIFKRQFDKKGKQSFREKIEKRGRTVSEVDGGFL